MKRADVDDTLRALESAGYATAGQLGIQDRWSIRQPPGPRENQMKVNLYVIVDGCAALRNHLTIRDELRNSAELRKAYHELKLDLASRPDISMSAYCKGKTDFLVDILKYRRDMFTEDELLVIEASNR